MPGQNTSIDHKPLSGQRVAETDRAATDSPRHTYVGPQSVPVGLLLGLQRSVGNQSVQRIVASARALIAQREINSPRFKGDADLEAVDRGARTLSQANAAAPPTRAVRLIQQALLDLGRPNLDVSGRYDAPTADGVKIVTANRTDEVDQPALARIDLFFSSLKVEGRLAKRGMEGRTRALAKPELQAVDATLLPPVPKIAGGQKAEFDWHNALAYRKEAFRAMEQVILRLSEGLEEKSKNRSDKTLMPWDNVDMVATAAKEATDAIFGSYTTMPALKSKTNLTDRWEDITTSVSQMNESQVAAEAEGVAAKYVRNSAALLEVNSHYNVDVGNEEHQQRLITPVVKALAFLYGPNLIEMHRHQPGSNTPGTSQVKIQRTIGEDRDRNVWDTFVTLIHEYIHTLAPAAYYYWVNKLDKDRRFTLTEGITDAFTRIVLANLTGEYVKLQQIYQTGRYAGTYAAAADRAEQMIGLIGVRNAYEGYFTAKVELLGVGPPIDKI